MAVVVAVRLAVGGDVGELRPRAIFVEGAHDPADQVLAALQELLEGQSARDGAVVEEEVDGAPRG